MADIEETLLPGVGVRHEFTTSGGERVALVTHRTGRRELAVYDRTDRDVCRTVLHLSVEDAAALTEVLGANHVSETVRRVQRLEGVAIDWVTVAGGGAGRTIADGAYRTRTGASIVAVVRGDATVPAPGPDEHLHDGDVVVAVGTPEGLESLRMLLA